MGFNNYWESIFFISRSSLLFDDLLSVLDDDALGGGEEDFDVFFSRHRADSAEKVLPLHAKTKD